MRRADLQEERSARTSKQSSTMTSSPPPPPPLLSLSVLRASAEEGTTSEEGTSDGEWAMNIPSQWSENSIPEIFKRRKGKRKKPWWEMRSSPPPPVIWSVERHPAFPTSFKESSKELLLVGTRIPTIRRFVKLVLSFTDKFFFD